MEQTLRLTTYQDLIEHGRDYLGASVTSDAGRDLRRAVNNAYRNLATMHKWSYYYTRGRLNTVAPVTGELTYDHTGGAYERMATIASGSWPAWSPYATLLIGQTVYQVTSLKSSTQITLSPVSNPGDDLAAGTDFTLYRDTYPLPIDFRSAEDFVLASNSRVLSAVKAVDWLNAGRAQQTPGEPWMYTFMADPDYMGMTCLRFFPPPDAAASYDYAYQRLPRPLVLDQYTAGTVTASSSSATVAGTNTLWTANMIGSVLRLSANAMDLPTGFAGTNPFQVQRIITAVGSATSLTVDQVYGETLTGVKYTISDPADIEPGAMLTALHRQIERELRLARRMKSADEDVAYREAMVLAKEADVRSYARQAVGEHGIYQPRLADMPTGSDGGA